jgi:hypothetical protein
MKTAKTILAAAILSMALSISAQAGDIQTPTPPVAAPPPIEAPAEDGDIGTPGFAIDILLALLFLL